MVKHLGNLSDREIIAQIQENMYFQYYLGYSSFTTEAPFSSTLFMEIKKRLSEDLLSMINEIVALDAIRSEMEDPKKVNVRNVEHLKR